MDAQPTPCIKHSLIEEDSVFFSSEIRSREDVELALAGPLGRFGRADGVLVDVEPPRTGVTCLMSESNVPSYDMTETETGAVGELTVKFFTSL